MRVALKKTLVFAKHLLALGQRRDIDGDQSHLTAGNREIRRVFVETEGLAPSAFSSLGDEASDPRHLGVIEVADAHLVIRGKQIECRADATHIVGPCNA